MGKYMKKPVVIEAVQWFPGKDFDGVVVVGAQCDPENGPTYEAYISTLEGDMRVSPGDYVITGVRGEKYPCKPDIFEETYEAVEE